MVSVWPSLIKPDYLIEFYTIKIKTVLQSTLYSFSTLYTSTIMQRVRGTPVLRTA